MRFLPYPFFAFWGNPHFRALVSEENDRFRRIPGFRRSGVAVSAPRPKHQGNPIGFLIFLGTRNCRPGGRPPPPRPAPPRRPPSGVGKELGKSWERVGKELGKSWEKLGKSWERVGKSWETGGTKKPAPPARGAARPRGGADSKPWPVFCAPASPRPPAFFFAAGRCLPALLAKI